MSRPKIVMEAGAKIVMEAGAKIVMEAGAKIVMERATQRKLVAPLTFCYWVKIMQITQQVLKQLLDYNEETGIFTWLPRDQEFFKVKSEIIITKWNIRFAGKVAGAKITPFKTVNGTRYGRTSYSMKQ